MSSLEKFAAENPMRRGSPCWLCNIPERAEAEAGRAKGLTVSLIVQWLKVDRKYGDKATPAKVGQHLREHVAK